MQTDRYSLGSTVRGGAGFPRRFEAVMNIPAAHSCRARLVADRVLAAVAILVVSIILLGTSGCTTVRPWEMSGFSSYIMRSDRDPLDESFREHVYFTREAAAGGRGVGGGGCGCN